MFKKLFIKEQISNLILDIDQIKTNIYILINKNYNIICKYNIKKIGLLTKDKLYSENNDILFQCIIKIEKKNLEIIKYNNLNNNNCKYNTINKDNNCIIEYEKILLNNDNNIRQIFKLLIRDYSSLKNNYYKYNISNNILNKDIVFNSIKYYYKDIEEIYDSIKKKYENKSIIEELNNYKEQI